MSLATLKFMSALMYDQNSKNRHCYACLSHSKSLSELRVLVKGEPGCCRYEERLDSVERIGIAELEDTFTQISSQMSRMGAIKLDCSDVMHYVRQLREKKSLQEA